MSSSPLRALAASGTKLWLDSIDLELVRSNKRLGATGATSNPIIVADLVKAGHGAAVLTDCLKKGLSDADAAWRVTDHLVSEAEAEFRDVFTKTSGDDGYVSFELDPLVEDPDLALPHEVRVRRYVELGKKWLEGHPNRMIKVPATPAGIAALTPLAAAGIPLNVTLIFTHRQYVAAREAVLKGIEQRGAGSRYKSVYSIFVSRLDVYAETKVPGLSRAAALEVGTLNAKRIWGENRAFWASKSLPLSQEIVFASTGVKDPALPAWKYVEALAGSDIQTNPPATNAAVEKSGRAPEAGLARPVPPDVAAEIDSKVDMAALEETLMTEGIAKFVAPQKALLALVAAKRASV